MWLLLLLVPAVRAPAGSRADVGTARLTSFNLQAMLSSASWAVLVTGFPTLLEITSPGADAAEVAIVILAVSVTRSPIMIPLQAFQGVLITTIADAEPSRRLTSVLRILGILLAGGALLAIVVAAVGPWLVRAVYGAQYDPSPGVHARVGPGGGRGRSPPVDPAPGSESPRDARTGPGAPYRDLRPSASHRPRRRGTAGPMIPAGSTTPPNPRHLMAPAPSRPRIERRSREDS